VPFHANPRGEDVPHHAFFIYEVHHHSRKQTEYDLKVRWGAGVTAMAVMVCVGVDEEGFREVLAVEVAGSEKGTAYGSLL
jgi:hypothetical protein